MRDEEAFSPRFLVPRFPHPLIPHLTEVIMPILGNRWREGLLTLLLLSPGLAGFFGLFFYPMLLTVILSFRPEGQETGWTLTHYARFLGDPAFRDVLGLTFSLAVGATLSSVLLSLPLALVLRDKPKGNRLFRLAILLPMMMPHLISALGLLLFWSKRGWANLFLLTVLPFLKQPVAVNYTIPGLILFYVWLFYPYTCLTTLSSLEALDRSIEEAAEVAGANHLQVLWHIVLPLIRPGVLAGSVLTFMMAFGAFSVPLVTGGNYRPLSVQIFTHATLYLEWSAASAMAVVMAIAQVTFLTIYMRVLRRPIA